MQTTPEENDINALMPDQQQYMARLVLFGWDFKLIILHPNPNMANAGIPYRMWRAHRDPGGTYVRHTLVETLAAISFWGPLVSREAELVKEYNQCGRQ